MSEQVSHSHTKLQLHFWLLVAACVIGTFISGPSLSTMPFGQWAASGLIFSFLTVLPLLCFIPTILKPNARNVSWLGFFLLAYFVWALLKTLSPNHFIGGALIITFNMTTFFYVVVWLRPLKKAAKARKAEEEALENEQT